MDSAAFVEELVVLNRAHLDRIDAMRDAACALPGRAEVVRRLKLALRQELEAAEIAALWIPSTPQVDVKLAMGKLCGDETRHFQLIVSRLAELGEVAEWNPLADGRSKLYDFFAGLDDTVERIAAAHFTREAIGHLRNEQFIEFCSQSGDEATANMYRRAIQPDEWSHVEVGRALLQKYAQTAEAQERARAAAERTLSMAEGAVDTLIHQQHMSHAPGC